MNYLCRIHWYALQGTKLEAFRARRAEFRTSSGMPLCFECYGACLAMRARAKGIDRIEGTAA